MNALFELKTDLGVRGYSMMDILCAEIQLQESNVLTVRFPIGGCVRVFAAALEKLIYDDGYGCQYLFGLVWMRDGTWFERDEYDGAEWWAHRKTPPVPNYLK